ncbi:hypothetical protein OXX80_013336, partial [Metschnikowia pulcherrima]
ALSVVNRNAIVKLTVEIAEGKTKDVLKDMYKLYEPNLVVAGSKSSVKNSAPLKSWTSSRLSDRLVKLFPLPVIVVPAPNLGPFERRLGMAVANKSSSDSSGLSQEGSERDFSSSLASPARINPSSEDSDAESISDRSLRSESSTDSEGSSNSYSSFDEIADLYNEYKSDMNARLDKLKAEN